MNIWLAEYKHHLPTFLLVSIFVHVLILLGMLYLGARKFMPQDELVVIDEVEFMERQKKIPKKVNIFKMALPKVVNKEEKIEIKELKKEKPKFEEFKDFKKDKLKLKDKELPMKKKMDLDLDKKFDKKDHKLFDLDKQKSKTDAIKTMELEKKEILIDKDSAILKENEMAALINLEEVGDRKISEKTLEIVNKITKNMRVNAEFMPEEKLVDKDVSALAKKVARIGDKQIVVLNERNMDRVKTVEILDKDKSKDRHKILVLADKAPAVQEKKFKKRAISKPSFEAGPSKSGAFKLEERAIARPKRTKIVKRSYALVKKEEAAQIVDTTIKKKKKKGLEISGPIKDRKILEYYVPQYPDWARERGIEASTTLFFVVKNNGQVDTESIMVEITSGYSALDNLAKETLLRWKFVPIQDSGDEGQWGYIVFRFKLT